MKLPTRLARLLIEDHVNARIIKTVDTTQAIASFQRLAVANAPFETCLGALVLWFAIDKRKIAENSPEMEAIRLSYDLTKQEVLGTAIDAIMHIMDASVGASKDKLAAAAIINELFGEKELIHDSVLTDRLMINLVGKD